MLKRLLNLFFPISITDWKDFLIAIKPDSRVIGTIKNSHKSDGSFSYRIVFRAVNGQGLLISYTCSLAKDIYLGEDDKGFQVVLRADAMGKEVLSSVPRAKLSLNTKYGTPITDETIKRIKDKGFSLENPETA